MHLIFSYIYFKIKNMFLQISLFLTLLFYSIIVSQSFMYIIALRNVSRGLTPNAYLEFRQLIDTGFRKKFVYIVYGALTANLLLVIATLSNPGSMLFTAAVFSFGALLVDTSITIKGNLPINDHINTWTANTLPANWADVRDQWLSFYQYRQIANISGFLCLLIGTVFGG
jgi:hypothetical protein